MKYKKPFIAGIITSLVVGFFYLQIPEPQVEEALGAPSTEVTYQKNLIPLTDSLYTVGTTTKAWLNGFFDQLCLGGDCKTAWPTGGAGGGSGTISTSSPLIAGELLFATGVSTTASVATGTLTENATGLEFSATRGLVGGASILSLTSGYVVPTTTRANLWDGKQDTITAGDALTLTGTDIDFDGGATPSGDLGGTWASPSVTDDSHAHTGTTLSGIDISADTNLSADGTEIVLTGDALSLGTALTFTTGTSTTSFQTGLLGVGTDYISDITGTGLSITNGVLNVTSSGGDGVSNWTFSGTTLSPSTTPVGISVATTTITVDAIATGVTDGLVVKNTTAATAGVPKQYSPEIVLSGTAYRSIDTSSNVKSWSIQAQPQNGSTDLDNILDITDVGGSRVLRLSSNEGGGGYVAVGGASIYSYSLVPGFNNGGVLGSTALQWSDLFLAEGGVINWDNGDATLTQVGNTVTLAGAGFNTTNATSTASFFSALGTFTNSVVNTLLTTAGLVVTSFFDLVSGSNPTVDAEGEMALNTATMSFSVATSTTALELPLAPPISFAFASSSWTGTTTVVSRPTTASFDELVTTGICYADGSGKIIVGNGTASSTLVNLSAGTTTVAVNMRFNKNGTRMIYAMGTPTASISTVNCSFSRYYLR